MSLSLLIFKPDDSTDDYKITSFVESIRQAQWPRLDCCVVARLEIRCWTWDRSDQV